MYFSKFRYTSREERGKKATKKMLLLRKILYCLVLIAVFVTAGITEEGLTQENDGNAIPFSSASDVFVYSFSGSYYVAPTGNDSNIGAADGAHDFVLNRVELHHFELYGFDASPSGGADCYNGSFNNCTAHTGVDSEQNVDGFVKHLVHITRTFMG